MDRVTYRTRRVIYGVASAFAVFGIVLALTPAVRIAGGQRREGTRPDPILRLIPGAPRGVAGSPDSFAGNPIKPEFFGLHINRINTPWPDSPFGSLRVYDDLTPWLRIEGEGRNRYRWEMLDRWLDRARRHRVQLFYTFANIPDWAAANPEVACGNPMRRGTCSPPSDLFVNAPCQGPLSGITTTDCQFKEYITSLMNRVCSGQAPNRHCQIQSYGCWNEPNLDGFWSGTYDELAKLCSDVVQTVKAQCQDCLVVSPEISAAAGGGRKANGESRDYAEYLRQFLRAYAKYGNYPDVAAFHAYAARTYGLDRAPFPETFRGSDCHGGGGGQDCPETLPQKIATLRAIYQQNGMAGKPVWITEGGWGTNNEMRDPDAQAAFLARWYILQASIGVQRAFWYMWDMGGRPQGWGGLWSPEQGTNMAGKAYGVVFHWLVGATFAVPCRNNNTVWTCELKRPGGYEGQIVWDNASSYQHEDKSQYHVDSKYQEFHDLSGAAHPIANGIVSIGTKPILLDTRRPH